MSDVLAGTGSSPTPSTSSSESFDSSSESTSSSEVHGQEQSGVTGDEGSSSEVPSKEPQPKVEKPKYKVKVDGEEQELDIDEIIRGYSHNKAAQKRFDEAAKMKREADNFLQLLKSNPAKVLSDPSIGVDLKKFAEDWYYENVILEEKMTPEEKERRDLKNRLAEYEERDRKEKEAKEQQELEELQKQHAGRLTQEITSALDEVGIPKTPRTVRKMAKLMAKNLEKGFQLSPAECAEIVRDQYREDITHFFSSYDEDGLLKFLGDDLTDKVRKADYKRYKAKLAQEQKEAISKPIVSDVETEKKPQRPMTEDEFRDYLLGRRRK